MTRRKSFIAADREASAFIRGWLLEKPIRSYMRHLSRISGFTTHDCAALWLCQKQKTMLEMLSLIVSLNKHYGRAS